MGVQRRFRVSDAGSRRTQQAIALLRTSKDPSQHREVAYELAAFCRNSQGHAQLACNMGLVAVLLQHLRGNNLQVRAVSISSVA